MSEIETVRRGSRRRSVLHAVVVALTATGLAGSGALVGPASAAVPGLQQVAVSTPSDSVSPKSVTASCPSPKRLVGTGAHVAGVPGQVLIERIHPVSGAVRVIAYEDENGFAGNWSLSAYAVCADPLPGLEIVSAVSASDSSSPKGVTVGCSPGKQVVGTGAATANAPGQVRLTAVAPGSQSVSIRAYEDESGFAGVWSVRAFAVCANPVAGQEIVSAATASDSNSPKGVTANCSPGKRVLGVGAATTGGFFSGQVAPTTLVPTGTAATTRAYEDETLYPGTWALRAYAICATP